MPCPDILIGHNRWASHGDPADNRNNHPFVTGRFAFIHNGVVANVDVAKENLKLQSECDSEVFFRYFLREYHNYGGEGHPVPRKAFNVLEKVMKRFDEGDFACALVDNRHHYLYLFRNAGRPIWITALPFANIVVFASTKDILTRSLNAHGIHVPEKACKFLGRGVITRIDENCAIKTYQVELRDPKKAVDVYSQYLKNHAINPTSIIHPPLNGGNSGKSKGVTKKSSLYADQTSLFANDYSHASQDSWDREIEKKRNEGGDWKCGKCGKSFLTAFLCKIHLIQYHKVDPTKCRTWIENVKYPNLSVDFSNRETGEVVVDGIKIPASEV